MADFLKGIVKDLEKAGFKAGEAAPPRYWFSTGNYVMNKTLGGSYLRGIPQGRITAFVGPSMTGKSFLACNAMREAQKDGAIVIVIDSEHSLDTNFVKAIGVDPDDENYFYYEIDTIPEMKKLVSKFTTGYKKEYGSENSDAPKFLFVIDSLDMLLTETEEANYGKGVSKGDQGQRNKQLKAVLREFVQAIKHHNISMIVTSGVYKNQDLLNGEGLFIVKDSIKYALSHIAMLTKRKLKDEKDAKNVLGINLIVEGYKTRFTQPFQKVTMEVPYETGIDPFSGLAKVAIELGILTQKGAYYSMDDDKKSWYMKDGWNSHKEKILELCEAKCDKFLNANISDDEVDMDVGKTGKQKRDALHLKTT